MTTYREDDIPFPRPVTPARELEKLVERVDDSIKTMEVPVVVLDSEELQRRKSRRTSDADT